MRHTLIVLLLITSTAHAETWLQLANLDAKGGRLLLDTASIDRGTDVRTAWFKSVYTSNHPIGDAYRDVPPGADSYRWQANLGHFDCTARKVAVSQSILHGADDEVVGKLDVDPKALTFGEVAPQSFGALLLEAVCASSTSDAPSTVGLARITRVVSTDKYYPEGSIRRGEEGAPVVKVCVGPSGKLLREPEITDTSGFPELDGAAIHAAKDTRYAAAIQDGAPMAESCIKYKVKFVRFPY